MDDYKKIENEFIKNQDFEKSIQMANYMRNKFEFYGIPAAVRRNIYKDFLKQEKFKKEINWGFLDNCYKNNYREFQYLALDYLSNMLEYLKYDDIFKIKKFVDTKPWWDTIDTLDSIIGNIGLRDKRVDKLMLKWSKDKDFWVRRVAIDHQLNRKEKTDENLLKKIICNNFGSEEFFINKAIGWSLREYSKYNKEWVSLFINKHKNEMSNLSIREASKYL